MRRVIKIGGSLLTRDALGRSIQAWVRRQPPAETFAIVGGGEMIEAVRRLDAAFACDPAWLHWQCVAMLRFTFEWLGQQLDDWQLHATAEQFEGLQSQLAFGDAPSVDNHLVDVKSFYRLGSAGPLPENWTTTTDAIAGWLSVLLDADELVLLKSCDVDEHQTLVELAEQGVIDSALPILADKLPPVRFVNFSAETTQ